jgi:hypothetical protein
VGGFNEVARCCDGKGNGLISRDAEVVGYEMEWHRWVGSWERNREA